MLQPKKQKHRKEFRRRGFEKGVALQGNKIKFGSYGLKAITGGEVTSRQIEAARKTITKYIKRGGKLWITIFPHKTVTKKAQEVPMGAGKGAPDHFAASIKPGRIIFEMGGIEAHIAKEAMKLAAYKLPVKCKFINIKELL